MTINKRQIFLIFFVKILIAGFFSSGYTNELFKPFVTWFINNWSNPWEHFYLLGKLNIFPYPPLMLYLHTVAYLPITLFHSNHIWINNVMFKLPTLLADMSITYFIFRLLPTKKYEVIIFYVFNPIIFYAVYMHSQLDLIPTALFFASIYYLLKSKNGCSVIFFGLALSTKFHILAALPIILLYLYKNNRVKDMILFIIIPFGIYLFFAAPFLASQSFQTMVLFNKEQGFMFDVYHNVGDIKIYAAPLAVLFIYMRFAAYNKINNDLLIGGISLLFSCFVLLIPPAPAWYVWFLPFTSVFLSNYYRVEKRIMYLHIAFSIVYLTYFIFFHQSNFINLQFGTIPLDLYINNPLLKNCTFTLLWGILFTFVYQDFKYSIRSNSVYKKRENAYVIGIGGDSGSGKTTILEAIKLLLSDRMVHIEGDGDHKWERGDENWNTFTHLDPKANYLHKQAEDVFNLKKWNPISRKDYDHYTGKFTEDNLIHPQEYVILSGLHLMYLPKMRKAIDLKIYIDTEERLRRHWKICRDTLKRGYSTEKILAQIESRIADAQKYIYPQKDFANVIIKYFASNQFELGNDKSEPNINLEISLDSSINLESFISLAKQMNVNLQWDYSVNLNHQILIFDQEYHVEIIQQLASELIINLDELISNQEFWKSGYQGIIQLIIMMIVSESKKQKIDFYDL